MFTVDDSNQIEFRHFLQNLEAPVKSYKVIAQFFGCDQASADLLEKNGCGIPPLCLKELLRVVQLPNCKDEIDGVTECLAQCCYLREAQYDYQGTFINSNSECGLKLCHGFILGHTKVHSDKMLQGPDAHVRQ